MVSSAIVNEDSARIPGSKRLAIFISFYRTRCF